MKLPGVKAPSVKEGATAAVLMLFNTDSVAGVKETAEEELEPEIWKPSASAARETSPVGTTVPLTVPAGVYASRVRVAAVAVVSTSALTVPAGV